MALNKLYYIYGLDTSCFYTDEEFKLEKQLNKARAYKNKCKMINEGKYAPKFLKLKLKNKEIDRYEYDKLKDEWCKSFTKRQQTRNETIYRLFHSYDDSEKTTFNVNKYISNKKNELLDLLSNNLNNTTPRTVRLDKILDTSGNPKITRRVSVFDSELTRCLGMREREFNVQMLIVKVYYFDVANHILQNGFILNGEKYVFFSASAGQIRTKKFVAVKESLLKENWNRLTAGLSIESINKMGGMNINKYLAYLALCNSGTDCWENFNIDKSIVVKDFETTVAGVVDYIDDKTFEINRVNQELPIAQMDGCGIMLPSVSDKNFMIRLPWVKGLLATFDFRKFIKDNNASPIITDVYGNKHDAIKEDIQIIFTASQFKMWKYFDSWEDYKERFKKYDCHAGICNKEEDEFPDSVITYQMIQSLPDLSDEELIKLGARNKEDITKLAYDKQTMLDTFGIKKHKPDSVLSDFQKCLKLYPELLQDLYCRRTLRDLKNKMERDLWSGKFKLGGKYTFVIPDLYAFCEWLFLGIEKPMGLLKDGQVSCRLFKIGEELDCLRSPHLYCEHAIRKNTYYNWFTTNAIYISSHDFISRILQCDFDGDKLLVINNSILINAAKRNMEGKVPLYYEMKKAHVQPINAENLWNGLRLAYTGGNIGEISNHITKIWNSSDVLTEPETIDYIKMLCMNNNFVIDYAKTLYKPTVPSEIKEKLKFYDRYKVPHFFIFAKGKDKDKVEHSMKSPVNRIRKIFRKQNIKYHIANDNVGIFDYKMLMNDPNCEYDESVGRFYREYVSNNMSFNQKVDLQFDDKAMSNYQAVYAEVKKNVLQQFSNCSKSYVIDNIIMYLFDKKQTYNKKAFWELFESEVYENLIDNLETQTVVCENCGKRFRKSSNATKYCPACRGYQPIQFKTLTCVDCGKEFVVNSKNNHGKRCEECQHKKQLEYQRISMAKKRNVK